MKRKGFTLAELLIVVAIIGVLASMMMVSGSGAANTARAMKIVEGFESVSAAMLTYYTNNADKCDAMVDDKGNTLDEAGMAKAIQAGIAKFLKDGGASVTPTDTITEAKEGKYFITVYKDDKSWWLTYTLPDDATEVGAILKDKAESLGLKQEVDAAAKVYEGADTITMKVR